MRVRIGLGSGFHFYGGVCPLAVRTRDDEVRLQLRKGQLRPARLRVPARGTVEIRLKLLGRCAGGRPVALRLGRKAVEASHAGPARS